jgi:riboflavin kinase/FMN adenylyltransferase
MQLYRTIAGLSTCAPAVPRAVAVGVFDGLHLGHQAIIEAITAAAAAAGGRSLVFTFEPTPKEFFAPDNPPARLTRFRERFEALAARGVDELFCPRFGVVRTLAPESFVEDLLVRGLRAAHVVVGDDFRFGAQRRGTPELLHAAGRRLGFAVTQMQPVFWRGRRVSSTAIREALAAGDLQTARGMLGRDYSISGRVVRGLGLGKGLGFPTANVGLQRPVAPVDGIFAVRVTGLGREALPGVASVGTRPTIGGTQALLEVYIFDFDRDIYGRHITVHFVRRLREERHFPDMEALRAQMSLDAAAARAALSI